VQKLGDKEFSRKVKKLINLSKKKRVPMGKLARKIAERRFSEIKKIGEEKSVKKRLIGYIKSAAPAIFKKPFAVWYYTKMLRS